MKDKRGTYHIFSWKLKKKKKNSKLSLLHIAFATNAKYFGCSIEIQFSKTPLAVQKNNYSKRIVNPCIIDDLDYWTLNSLNNFTLKNYLFVATNIVRNSDKFKYMYSD